EKRGGLVHQHEILLPVGAVLEALAVDAPQFDCEAAQVGLPVGLKSGTGETNQCGVAFFLRKEPVAQTSLGGGQHVEFAPQTAMRLVMDAARPTTVHPGGLVVAANDLGGKSGCSVKRAAGAG